MHRRRAAAVYASALAFESFVRGLVNKSTTENYAVRYEHFDIHKLITKLLTSSSKLNLQTTRPPIQTYTRLLVIQSAPD